MGKYTEALRKLEEERKKKKSESSEEPSNSNVQSLKGYLIGTAICALVVLLLVYAYGVRSGTKLASSPPLEVPASKVETPSSEKAEPVSPIGQLAESGDNATLLESVEKMISLPNEVVPPKEIPQEAEATVQEQSEFYTIQLVTYESKERAREEANTLKTQGYGAFILRSNKFYSVCVDKFTEAAQAARRLSEIRKSFGEGAYQDAFVRFVKPKQGA